MLPTGPFLGLLEPLEVRGHGLLSLLVFGINHADVDDGFIHAGFRQAWGNSVQSATSISVELAFHPDGRYQHGDTSGCSGST